MPDADPDRSRTAETDPETLSALAAILALDPVTAARVRGLTPARRRPQRQTGPQLDLGDAGSGAPDRDAPDGDG